ncbi:MAG: phospho-N-acetylmuramoyl-pentapeptide-transferase [Myxococcota bacterium]
MLYHLLYPLSDTISAFNVFRYLTFRSIAAALTALLLAFVIAPVLIRLLEDRQIGQTIRDDPPQRHRAKAGTPTMGGVLIVGSLVLSTLLWSAWTNPYVWLVMAITLLFGAIGFYDDYQKAILKRPMGISARTKIALQVAVASLGATALFWIPGFDTQVSLPLLKHVHPAIGLWYAPLAVLVIVGTSNAVNLTDGLDGLAIGPVLITAAVIGLFAYVAGHRVIADYLEIKYVPGAGSLAIICAALVGAGLGFLWFNTYPASVFMGDTGALALGATLGTIAIVIRQEAALAIAGGIFVLEAVSVIVQVVSYKATQRRVFRMAPIHHHYELKGWPEPQIIVRFWIISIILGLISLALLKVR